MLLTDSLPIREKKLRVTKKRMTRWIDVTNKGARTLKEAGIGEAELEARFLLCHVYELSDTEFFIKRPEELSAQDEEKLGEYERLIEERAKRIPLSQITHSRWFMGMEFYVNEHVLTPRQDTEILVEEALKHCKGKKVLDMCTGSGCIAISLAVMGSPKEVVGIDVSEEALLVAKQNEKLAEGTAVRWIRSDLFSEVNEKFDLIVSNPPYIQTDVIKTLEPEVKDHEPMLALDGSEDGLLFYRKIAAKAPRFLTPGGYLLFEIGDTQGEAVSRLMRDAGFENVSVHKDLAGLDRVVEGNVPL